MIQDKEDENRWIRNYLIKYHLNKMPALVEFLEEQREKEFGGKQHEDMEVWSTIQDQGLDRRQI